MDGLTHALKTVMEDSHGRTGSFDEVAEILSEALHQTEVRTANVKKCLNGEHIICLFSHEIYFCILDIYITNARVGQLLHHAETDCNTSLDIPSS